VPPTVTTARPTTIPPTPTVARATTVAAQAATGGYPPDTKLTITTMPNVAQPAYLSQVTDSTFGTHITRIADDDAIDPGQTVIRHIYAKNSPWNADGSLVKLDFTFPAYLLDDTYHFLTRFKTPSQGLWSTKDPNKMWCRIYNGSIPNQLGYYDLAADRFTVLHTFSEFDEIDLGEGEGNVSNDDRYVALVGTKGSTKQIVVWDLLANSEVSRLDISNVTGTSLDNVSVSQSGNYVVMQWSGAFGYGRYQGVELYTRNLQFLRQLSPRDGSHQDQCYDPSGNEVLVIVNDTSSALIARRFSDGATTTLLDASLSSWMIHVSCRNIDRPGWVYISQFSPDLIAKADDQKVFALKIDGSQTVEVFGFTHFSPNASYERTPMAVPNRDGSKVLFASDWGNPTGPVYSYVAQR
jgi:hypothetical protein